MRGVRRTAVAGTPASVVSGSTMGSSELTAGSTPYSTASDDTTSLTASAMGPPPPRAPAALSGLAAHPMMAGRKPSPIPPASPRGQVCMANWQEGTN